MLNTLNIQNRLFSFTIIHLFVILSGMAALSWEVIWQIKSGLALSGFFLARNIYDARGMKAPDERIGFYRAVEKKLEKAK